MRNLDQLLVDYWGEKTAFRSHQRTIINDLAGGRDILAVLPTGEGKSLCYQLAGMLLKGLTVVLSPLLVLSDDQVQQLQQRKILAGALHSGQNQSQQRHIWQQLEQHQLQFLYLSPEQFQSARIQKWLRQHPPRLLVVDEAHCVSLWGHDFRPAYREWPSTIQQWPTRPVIAAFTATATATIRADIIKQCGLQQPQEFVMSAIRDNVTLQVHPSWTPAGRQRQLQGLLANRGKSLIYATTRHQIEVLAHGLHQRQIPVQAYHAGLTIAQRTRAYEWFGQTQQGVLVASTAFGMGVDIPDIAQVIHWDLPHSLEAYVQEAGRVARNRLFIGQAHLLYLRFSAQSPLPRYKLTPEQLRLFWQGLQNQQALAHLLTQLNIPVNQGHILVQALQSFGVLESGTGRRLQVLHQGPLTREICQHIQQAQVDFWQHQKQRWQCLQQYRKTTNCRRQWIDAYFGMAATTVCGQCDNCQRN